MNLSTLTPPSIITESDRHANMSAYAHARKCSIQFVGKRSCSLWLHSGVKFRSHGFAKEPGREYSIV